MSDVRARAGSVIATGIPAPRLDGATRRALVELAPSGIILFRRNYTDLTQLRELVRELHALPSRPLVAIDHEGGKVVRLGEPFTAFPAAAEVARGGDPALVYAVHEAMGRELAAAGIDVDFAPVLDVDSNPANPIIGARAFARDPDRVARFGVAALRGLLAGGVLPCGKHFPGHGDTNLDSHLALPTVKRSRAELEATELPPFRAAIAAGLPLLMTAHVVYPALDAERPATLSPRILGDLLRGELGYRGVVVSDDLGMRAVSDHHDPGDAAVASLRAGVDWLLLCNEFDVAVRVGERLARDLESGALNSELIDAAAGRVRALRVPPRPPEVALPAAAHRDLLARLARA